jgi:hypothetical protein
MIWKNGTSKLFQIFVSILAMANFFLFFSRGEDDYMPGNIIEIELRNFMTYDYLVCKPGSRLNLVIGPNGSGKSSIVCAIALGLGGEPQVGCSLLRFLI